MDDTRPTLPASPDETDIQTTEPVSDTPALYLPISDGEFLDLVRRKLDESKAHFSENQIEERRKTNERFWKGKQLASEDDYDPELRNVDNLIYRNEETKIALASSRIPDIIADSPDKSPEGTERSRLIESILNARLSKPEKERLIKNGLRHHDLYFIGCIKVWWDKSLGKNGDYTYTLVKPKNLVLDPHGYIPDDGFSTDGLEFIAEYLEEPLSVVAAKFPEKKDELYEVAGINDENDKKLSRKIRYLEVWSTYYGKDGKKYEMVGWCYKDLVLGKELNSYFDFEGYETTDETGAVEQRHHNHFEFPRKPYILFSYQNLGYDPLDSTTVIEQAIPLQELANTRQRQITAIANRSVPKYFFSGKAITREGAAEVSNDPNEHVVLEEGQFENIRDVVLPVMAQPPSPILFQDLLSVRTQLDSMFSTHSTTRGEALDSSSGRSKAITREGDLQIADDVARIMVQRVVYEMANWAMQMMKYLYQEAHLIHDLGVDGKTLYAELSRDMIPDGLLVTVNASSLDREERKVEAMQLAQQKAIDPFTLFEELGVQDPKERVKRLMAYLGGAQDFYAQYNQMLGLNDGEAQTGQPQILEGDKSGGMMAPEPAPQEAAPALNPDQQAAVVDQVIAAGGTEGL